MAAAGAVAIAGGRVATFRSSEGAWGGAELDVEWRMMGRPETFEAAPFYFQYIDLVREDDPVAALARQMEDGLAFYSGISEEQSLYRYAPGKWSVREVLGHISDTERIFACRAMWFARGLQTAMPGFDQDAAARNSQADNIAWAELIDEFRHVRLASIDLFQNLPEEAWSRGGLASEKFVTVRALAYAICGHAVHHGRVVQEQYLVQMPG